MKNNIIAIRICWFGGVWKSLASNCVTEISASRPASSPPERASRTRDAPWNDPSVRSFFPLLFIPCRWRGAVAAAAALARCALAQCCRKGELLSASLSLLATSFSLLAPLSPSSWLFLRWSTARQRASPIQRTILRANVYTACKRNFAIEISEQNENVETDLERCGYITLKAWNIIYNSYNNRIITRHRY